MITGKKVRLRKRKLVDATNNYTWQTDPELVRLDASPVLTTTFPQYLSVYLNEMRYPSANRHAFAIETLDSKHIGNCSYYDTNEMKGEAELGIMIGNRDCWDKGYGTDAVTTLLNYIFRKTNLKRVYLKTLDSNRRAQRCFEKCGFTPYGHLNRDGYNFVLMEIHRKQGEKRQPVEEIKANGMIKYVLRDYKTILNKYKFIDSWFWCRYSINPYNGCQFACTYCDSMSTLRLRHPCLTY